VLENLRKGMKNWDFRSTGHVFDDEFDPFNFHQDGSE
jgi:hypothetical protein